MKSLFYLPLIVGFCSKGFSQTDFSSPGKGIYGIKSCKLVMRFYWGIEQGEKTIIFDDWGKIEKEYGSSTTDTTLARRYISSFDSASKAISAIKSHENLLIIKTPTVIYTIDLDKKTGYKQDNAPLFELPQSMLDSMEVTIGVDTLLGKRCTVKEFGGQMRLWYWNNFIIKKELLDPDHGKIGLLEYAIEIDENYKIKPDEFDVPKGIIIKDPVLR